MQFNLKYANIVVNVEGVTIITNNSTSNTDWKYTKGTWGTANAPVLTGIGNDKYTLSISDIRAYYGVPSGESIEKIENGYFATIYLAPKITTVSICH